MITQSDTPGADASSAFPLHRFEEFGDLSASEHAAIETLGDAPRHYRRHDTIRRQGETPAGFYLLVGGWVAAARTFQNGGRQILKVHLPGDAVGTPSMCVTEAAEALICLTDATLIEVPFSRFGKIIEDHPLLGARFMLSIQLERVILMDRIASAGQTAGLAQIAALILDFRDRLEPLNLVSNNSFFLRLTQEQIGNLLGMTPVHINRLLKRLTEIGLIRRRGQRMFIEDEIALGQLAQRRQRMLARDAEWLPTAR